MKGGWFSRLLITRHRISFLLMRFHHGFFQLLDAFVKENVIIPADGNQKKELLFGIAPRKVTSFMTK